MCDTLLLVFRVSQVVLFLFLLYGFILDRVNIL